MRIVTANEWQQWLDQGVVLERDGRGPKVIRLSDGQLLKIFRPRRRLWLAGLKPQACRFAANALQLQARKVRAPVVGECFWVDRAQAVSACLYTPLPGTSLDRLYQQSREEFDALLPELAVFINSLHRRGIYFRSLHLGNVLRLPDGGFGLIDFLDMRFKRGPLGAGLVKRNLAHLQGYLQRSRIDDFPWQALLAAYKQACADAPKA
ncbi:toluene tolerance protein [Pseudomonas sp. MAP12]|uniref:Toluene tolerance protein n=1 Tax=Geopseudomonas aromaticivorans TaxID=2849492 RepID=A0ABS6MXQ4_9GAMM|nr:toluene tolerance protein [Pseudomonas aromaticivorans]MBV2133595.1 toluene tolerance protein [Pseudomonas aromaticivorans]